MERETQNLAWCGLPKDTRGAIRMHRKFSQISGHTKDLLESLFGKHNLESDTEPEEMLMVKRKKVQEAYRYPEGYADSIKGTIMH